eukprot:5834736-Pyramimonas_sp.AAC.2
MSVASKSSRPLNDSPNAHAFRRASDEAPNKHRNPASGIDSTSGKSAVEPRRCKSAMASGASARSVFGMPAGKRNPCASAA